MYFILRLLFGKRREIKRQLHAEKIRVAWRAWHPRFARDMNTVSNGSYYYSSTSYSREDERSIAKDFAEEVGGLTIANAELLLAQPTEDEAVNIYLTLVKPNW